jgi:hypothetical protein
LSGALGGSTLRAIVISRGTDPMNINDYLSNPAATSFPPTLVLNKDIAGDFYRLWSEGERRGIEIGQNMLFSAATSTLSIDKTQKFDGTANYTVFGSQDGANVHGDVHTHPANSIGHVNGYAAHSIQDIQGLSQNAHKPVFIRFVASGNYIYAVVHRNGHSQLDTPALNDLMGELERRVKTLFLQKMRLTEDERVDKLALFDTTQEAEMWMLNSKKKAPGFGSEMQRLSQAYCVRVANAMSLGFYVGYRGWLGWYTNQAFTLTRTT